MHSLSISIKSLVVSWVEWFISWNCIVGTEGAGRFAFGTNGSRTKAGHIWRSS